MPYEKAPSSGAFLPLSLMYFLSGEPMHDLSGVDSARVPASRIHQDHVEKAMQPGMISPDRL